jgi:hypothetical protein
MQYTFQIKSYSIVKNNTNICHNLFLGYSLKFIIFSFKTKKIKNK